MDSSEGPISGHSSWVTPQARPMPDIGITLDILITRRGSFSVLLVDIRRIVTDAGVQYPRSQVIILLILTARELCPTDAECSRSPTWPL